MPAPKKYQFRDELIAKNVFLRDPPSMTAWAFMRIAAWKSAYIPAAISVGHPEEIEQTLCTIFTRLIKYKEINLVDEANEINWDEWEGDVHWMLNDTGLLSLPGVGYAFATALLSYLLPEAFPVMDRLTIGAVFGWDVARRTKSWYRTSVYRKYAEHLAKARFDEWVGLSVHERDQNLMSVMKPLEKTRSDCPFKSLGLLSLG
jgi:hypothetical protein